jgi:hypothetical protein
LLDYHHTLVAVEPIQLFHAEPHVFDEGVPGVICAVLNSGEQRGKLFFGADGHREN